MKNRTHMLSLRTACLVVGAGIGGAWLAPLVARAAASNAASPTLSFAGTLRQNGAPLTTPQTLAFVFKKNGVSLCQSADVPVTPDETGQFVAAIPIASCPASLFDGSEVKIDIAVNGDTAVTGQPVTSVPSAKFAEQIGFPDCPLGYERDPAMTSFILCRFGSDEVVRVGSRNSAFWIDRYEASVWDHPDGTGKGYGSLADGSPIPQNGQLTDSPKGYAVSKSGVQPTTYVTWFQADVACRASGKRMPSNAEWTFAATGTFDFGESTGAGGSCISSGTIRPTGQGPGCVSLWGAQDMIGNASEWTSEWYASPPTSTTGLPSIFGYWGPGYGDDWTTNLASVAGLATGWQLAVPSGMLRGGSVDEGTGAGVFSVNLSLAPNNGYANAGFRCVIPR